MPKVGCQWVTVCTVGLYVVNWVVRLQIVTGCTVWCHYLPPTTEEVNAIARVCLSACLSVCMLARLLKNAWMDLDEMLRVDRRRDMDELINY